MESWCVPPGGRRIDSPLDRAEYLKDPMLPGREYCPLVALVVGVNEIVIMVGHSSVKDVFRFHSIGGLANIFPDIFLKERYNGATGYFSS